MTRETMEYDVVIIGAGPAGLATAIRLGQLAKEKNTPLSVCIIEKGAEVGAHILSGAVLEPGSLTALIPDWKEKGAPLRTAVKEDKFLFLTKRHAMHLPTPPPMQNHGNYIISLGNLCRWLAVQAQELGVEIYPGFAASEILYDETNKVVGVATGDMGISKDGSKSNHYQPGMELRARQTVFAEGCRGSLTKTLFEKFNLCQNSSPQTYGLGIKELWEVDPKQHREGTVIHTVGWPLDHATYGGSFIYHLENNQVAVGFVVGLDYTNPHLSPFNEMQRFKTHPKVIKLFENGRRIAYGARALNEGGLQSIPKLTFPGGLIVGDAAGFLNVAKIKGTHTAITSGRLAAETIFSELNSSSQIAELANFNSVIKHSEIYQELEKVRNIRSGFRYGLVPGLVYAAIDQYLFRGKAPWTFSNHNDYQQLSLAVNASPIEYPKPDGKITFDRLSSVFLTGVNHEENQPCHLKLKKPQLAIDVNYMHYDSPEQYYCPAGVYEIIQVEGKPQLQINAANCIHCKTCDIKDPTQNINWTPPESGGGPNYPNM